MAETKKFVVVDGPINHDHELYINGDPIELTDKGAKRLLAEKKIVLAKPSGKKNDGGDEDKKDGGQDAGENAGGKDPGQKEGKEDDPKDKTKGQTKGGKK